MSVSRVGLPTVNGHPVKKLVSHIILLEVLYILYPVEQIKNHIKQCDD